MNYKPNPIDISKVSLSDEVLELSETLAENVHDVWAKSRLDQGWRHGLKRDDDLKRHPNIVPYEDLSESERHYDRHTALSTLKAVVALGYQIIPSPQPSTPVRDPSALRSLGPRRRQTDFASAPAELNGILSAIPKTGEEHDIATYRDVGERILDMGESLLAYDIFARGLLFWPNDVRLRQLQALALARTGSTWAANRILRELWDQGHRDGETQGILAGTHKDLWATDPSSKDGRGHLEIAIGYYSDAFRRAETQDMVDGAFYSGINVASMSLFLGREADAENTARKVRDLCMQRLEAGSDYWALATLGEAAIILGDLHEAERQYKAARKVAGSNLAYLSTSRRQARRLFTHLGLDSRPLDHWLAMPRVVCFAGLMIDRPDRPQPRFPELLEKMVYDEIVMRLDKMDAGVGYTAAACGSDILFIEAMLERGGEVHIVLPNEPPAFRRDSVDVIPGSVWGERFEKALERSTRVIVANSSNSPSTPIGYAYTYQLQDGMAILRGQTLETEVRTLAVWDRQPGDDRGGTASLVEYWRSMGRDPEIIESDSLLRKTTTSRAMPLGVSEDAERYPASDLEDKFPQEIMSIIFCDVSEYTQLDEVEIPLFVEHFMGTVEDVMRVFPDKPLLRNTWGDEVHCIFPDLRQAGRFALDLRDRIRDMTWEEFGLPADLNLRISLHAGPVFTFMDPILKIPNYTGSHVSRGSRIESVAPPGEILATREFAALCSSQGIGDFAFDYVGHFPLPKGGGTASLYLLRRGS